MGIIVDKFSSKIRFIFLYAAFMISSGYCLIAATYAGYISLPSYLFVCFYFFLVGHGSAASYAAAMGTNVRNWDNKHHGFAIGVPISCIGLSAFVFTQFANFFYIDAILDISSFLFFLGVISALANVIASYCIRDVRHLKPARITTQSEENQNLLESEESVPLLEEVLSVEELFPKFLSSFNAYLLALMLFIVGGCGLMYINNVGSIILSLTAENQGTQSPKVQSLQKFHVALISISSFLGRLIFGILSDFFIKSERFCFKKIPRVFWVGFSALVCFFGYVLGSTLGGYGTIENNRSAMQLTLCTIFIGTSYGAVNTSMPVLVGLLFGMKKYATNVGLISMFISIGSMFFSFIFSELYEMKRDSEMEYCKGQECINLTFQISALCNIIAVFLGILIWRRCS
ncbi:putative monocarboxylate transporter mch1 [Clydaea vesicula]|uniref:Monocarboxylate transporter mch1 n=1 Tax=Clydaea vesicula TaxID=447962 RepID=A0AAD5U780_9FUNG|nr:putative monocarboxylate transporter mch1 [Clydaea vesicula]